MCGRYVMATPTEALVERFDVAEVRVDDLPPSWNVAPTDPVAAIVEREGERRLGTLRWGLVPHWAKTAKDGAKRINARAETVHDNASFRDAFRRHRCLIPANGFYEWKRQPDGKKRPFFIRPVDGAPVAFAGLWAAWHDPSTDEWLRTCTIITTSANERVMPLHDRMPVVLDPADYATWLDPATDDVIALKALLIPAPDDALEVVEVSPAVNSVRNNGPELLAPVS
jgi:putative SOS response-associated peptidase YedK